MNMMRCFAPDAAERYNLEWARKLFENLFKLLLLLSRKISILDTIRSKMAVCECGFGTMAQKALTMLPTESPPSVCRLAAKSVSKYLLANLIHLSRITLLSNNVH